MLKKRNISRIDEIMGHVFFLNKRLMAVLTYLRAYRNSLTVIIHILRGKYPIEATLRDSKRRTTLRNHVDAFLIAMAHDHEWLRFDTASNTLVISPLQPVTDSDDNNNKRTIKLHGVSIGDIDIFGGNIYGIFPIKGKVVVDIGAGIGDSSIYFALSGAKKIIGLEPFPKIYNNAKKNIEANNLSDKIAILLAGCAAESKFITVSPDYESAATYVTESKGGINVPLLTLQNILDENNLATEEVVLKMDCEGCEYDTILSSTKETLRKFRYMLIEYHFGYKNLKEKLENCGFRVSVKRPIYTPTNDSLNLAPHIRKTSGQKSTKPYLGYIYASRD